MKKKVLFVCHTSAQLGGAAHSLYYMIKSIKNFIEPIVLLSDFGFTYDFFTQHGIECYVCKFSSCVKKKGTTRNILLFLPLLIQRLIINLRCVHRIHNAKLHIDLVHSNSSITSIGYFIAKREKVNHIWHIREFMDSDYGLEPFMGWDILRNRMRKSQKVIAISKAVYFHWRLNETCNSVILWNAVRSYKSAICEKTKRKYFLFCAGSLSDSKGADFAVKSFVMSKLYMKSYSLKLIGSYSEEYKEKLLEIVNENGVDKESIEFLGHVEDVDSVMKFATAFLMCSKNEGLGRVTIEAMFNGCPILARDTGGTLDFIANGENGYLFHDENQCAALMNSVAESDNTKIIKRAQEFAIEHFSLENYGSKIMEIYNSI